MIRIGKTSCDFQFLNRDKAQLRVQVFERLSLYKKKLKKVEIYLCIIYVVYLVLYTSIEKDLP